jgi:hypothetical protein
MMAFFEMKYYVMQLTSRHNNDGGMEVLWNFLEKSCTTRGRVDSGREDNGKEPMEML